MKEIKAIIEAYDAIKKSATKAALANVVRVEGSSYRRTGARMLVMDDGRWVGGISGGCLEGDALKRARLAIAKSAASLVTYDTTEGDAHQIGVGLGCNGIIDVLFTPLDYQNNNNPVEILKSCVKANRTTHVLLTISAVGGEWQHVQAGNVILYERPVDVQIFEDSLLEKNVSEKIAQQISNSTSAFHHFETADKRKLSLFIELLLPEIHLVLMGSQYDVYSFVRLIKETGWRATVVGNPLKINPAVISFADKVCGGDQLHETGIDKYTAIIVMSHDYTTDKINLLKALATGAFYIGLLGPKVRAEKIFRELAEEGHPVDEEERERIYAPAGLDIGAVSPEEIALSLMAEIRAVFSNRSGNFLRLRQCAIHENS